MNHPKTLALLAGVLYLIVGVFGGFAQGYFQPLVYVANDAAATLAQVQNHAALGAWGVAADLIQATVFVFLVLVLARLLRPYGEAHAQTMVVLVAIAVAIMTLNNVFEWGAFRVAADGQFLLAWGEAGRAALVYLLLDLQHTGLLIAQIFFGLWLVPLGLLTGKSKLFPRWLAVLLVAGGVCYLVNVFTLFLFPDFGNLIDAWIVLPCAVAEIAMVVALWVVGLKPGAWGRRGRVPTKVTDDSVGES